MAVENNVSIKTDNNFSQVKLQNNQQYYYKTNPNGVDKTPNKDTVELSNNSTAKKVGIGAAIAAVAIAAVCLLRGKKPPKQVTQQFQQAAENLTHEKPTMQMTEDAKKIYDDVASKLNKKTKTTAETVERNLAPKQKEGAWDSKDMREYYTQLEKESAKPKITITNNGNTRIIEEPIEMLSQDGKKHQLILQRTETTAEGVTGKRKEYVYTILNSDGKRIAECDGMMQTHNGEYVLDGKGIQRFSGEYKGLGTKLKEIIKNAATENGCKSINIEAAYNSHMFHNKMGYKPAYVADPEDTYNIKKAKGLLNKIKKTEALPDFTERIDKLLNSTDNNPETVNKLIDEIFTVANSKGMRSQDIGISGICVPMTYKL